MENMDKYGGDSSLLEIIVSSFLLSDSSKHPPEVPDPEKPVSPHPVGAKEEELDLGQILSLHDHEFRPTLENDLGPPDGETDGEAEKEFKVLFRRDDSSKDLLMANYFTDDERLVPRGEGGGASSAVVKRKFQQTKNDAYRTFMEELILVKCCTKQILQLLEDAKALLEDEVKIHNDPGFGSISEVQAWVWILKEAIVTSYASALAKNDKERISRQSKLVKRTFGSIEKLFKNFNQDIKNLMKTFNKVEEAFHTLASKANKRFAMNKEAALEYEMKAPAFNFLFHNSIGSKDSFEDCCSRKFKAPGGSKAPAPKVVPERALQIRCSIDGVTIRSGVEDTPWLKFQNVDRFEDQQAFMNIFMHAFCKGVVTSRQNVTWANEILEVHRRLFQRKGVQFKDSILNSIQKCKGIIETPKKYYNFLPKEEVMMLYSLKSAVAGFGLIKSLLYDMFVASQHHLKLVGELCSEQKLLKHPNKVSKRVPLDRLAKFEIEVEDTQISTAMILNRYPNLRDARQMKEKLLKKEMAQESENETGETEAEDNANLDTSLEMVYRCPSELHCTPSTQEMLELFRKMIDDERTISLQPNPAHFLLKDLEFEYKDKAITAAAKREITPEMISLCSDPIRHFYQVTEELNSAKEAILRQLTRATENLLYSEVHHDGGIEEGATSDAGTPPEKLVPASFWIQIICKLLHVWDFHSVPKHLQAHFLSVNDKTLNWLEKLENSYIEFGSCLNKFKDCFVQYHEYVESMHGFATWVKKNFHFKIPNELLTKWRNQIQTESLELEGLEVGNGLDSHLPTFQLNFSNFDVDLIKLDEERIGTYLLSLNKCSGNVQVGLVSTFFTHIDSIIKKATVNLNAAQSILEKNFSLKPLKASLCADKKMSQLKYLSNLEDLVMTLTFERNYRIIKEIISYIELLDRAISQFNRLVQTVQLQMEDQGIIESGKMSRKDRIRKKVLQDDAEHFNHDIWLNETKRVLRKSVEAMPTTYEIHEVSVKNSLANWAQLAEKDRRLKAYVHTRAKLLMGQETDDDAEETQDEEREGRKVEGQEVDDETDVEDKNKDGLRSEDEQGTSKTALDALPINFEEAMMQTTLGKAFFPDPLHFNTDIEGWRAVCFKMLATALDKFREMTTTKIIETKNTLSLPSLSTHLAKQEEPSPLPTNPEAEGTPGPEPEFQIEEKKVEEIKETKVVEEVIEVEAKVETTPTPDTKVEKTDMPTEGKEASEVKMEVRNVTYTEGLCSFLCFITSHLNPRDRVFISSSELKHLQDKFYAVTTAVEKFKKDLDASERILVNSLSLTMASVEYKNLPDFLPISPLENDYLKAHDLEEIEFTREVKKEKASFDLKSFTNLPIWRRSEKNVHPPSVTSLLAEPYEIELNWDSTKKNKLFCKFGKSDDAKWFELSQLHISAQLHLINLLVDEIMKEFQKARELIKEAKTDMACAKKLLQKTWKGIGKDRKRGRIPDSGVLVLVKLYRHQIATAVVNTKAIMKTAREVRFLLSHCVRNARVWVKEEDSSNLAIEPIRNYVMSQDNISLKVVLKPAVPKEAWVIRKEDKGKFHFPAPSYPKEEKLLDIMHPVDVTSSTSLDPTEGMISEMDLQNISMNKSSTHSLTHELRETLGQKLIGATGRDFHSIASTIETLILSGLEQSLAILKQPNCSVTYPPGEGGQSKEMVPNVVGILTVLAGATTSIVNFKDVVPVQRNFLVEKIRGVEAKLNKIRDPGSGTGHHLLHEVRKMKGEVEQLDKNFRSKFCYKTEFPPIGEVSVGPFQPVYGTSPMEFVEDIAAQTNGHVWTVINGVPELGILIKDNKTLESHALSNLPLKTRLEIFSSLVTFLEKLVDHAKGNLDEIKKDLETAKNLQRTHGKAVMKRKKPSSGKHDMSKWEIEENIHSFAKIDNAYFKAEDIISVILDLLKQAQELLQHVMTYLILKMRLEPVSGTPRADKDFIHRTQHWLTMEGMAAGLGANIPPPNIPPPIMLKKIKRSQKEENTQMKYKGAWENRLFELEVFFETFCRNHHIAVDVPLMFIPAQNKRGSGAK